MKKVQYDIYVNLLTHESPHWKKTKPSDKDKDKSQKIYSDAPNLTISITDGKNSQKIVTGASIRNHCKAFVYLFFKEGNFPPFIHNVSSINAWEWTFIFPGGVWASPRPSGGGRQRLGGYCATGGGEGEEEKEHISTVRHQRHNTTLQFYSFFGSLNGALLPCFPGITYRPIVPFKNYNIDIEIF